MTWVRAAEIFSSCHIKTNNYNTSTEKSSHKMYVNKHSHNHSKVVFALNNKYSITYGNDLAGARTRQAGFCNEDIKMGLLRFGSITNTGPQKAMLLTN